MSVFVQVFLRSFGEVCCYVRFVSYIDFVIFFFFKQNTAYEMRISDWSSDACSSDLPTEGDIAGQSRISEVIDRGAGKGALIFGGRKLSDQATGALLCTIERSAFLRNDGGFGGPYRRHLPQHMIPERPADLQCDLQTTGQQALLYRLNGDDNPLHADPAVARRAGFDLPVLHGLCTFGVAGHALLKSVCNYEPARVRSIGVRFTATAFPGDTIRTSIWRDEAGATFQCRAIERDAVIVDNGRLDFA